MWNRLSDLFSFLQHPARTGKILLGILLLAALPRILLLSRISEEDFYHNDGREYMEISRQLAAGNGFSLSYYRWHEVVPPDAASGKPHPDLARTPLFPLLGAGLFFLPWNVTSSAKAVSLLVSLLAVFCVFLLGKELAGRGCGLWSALCFAVYPYAVYYAASWSTENLFLICLSLSFLFLLKTLHGRFCTLPWSGLFLGLAALTRPTAVLLPFLFGMMLWLRFMVFGSLKWHRKNLRWFRPLPGRLWLSVCIFLLIFAMLLLPWMYRNRKVGGSWNPATYYDGYIFWLSFSPILLETYRTLDTPEYSGAVEKSWNKEHAERHEMLRKKGITTFVAASEQWREWGREQILRNPGDALYLVKERFLHYWRMCPNLVMLKSWQIWLIRSYFTVIFLLALAGAAILRRRLELLMPLLPVFFGMAISVPFLFVLRFRFPFFAPYICILAGCALSCGLGRRIKKLNNQREKICNPEKE